MKVAVAVIFDSDQRILITQRPVHAPHGGLWEFPGGKLENGEDPNAALIREIKEEVGLEILNFSFLFDLSHDYGNKRVQLLIYKVDQYKGKASCCESQIDLRWVFLNELAQYPFPEANLEIINLLNQYQRAMN